MFKLVKLITKIRLEKIMDTKKSVGRIMKKFEIDKQVKVFISSGCGNGTDKSEFDDIRQEIKKRLEKFNFIKVYLFEDDKNPSSKSVKNAYLDELDDSDICIFLIDNSEPIPAGVNTEYQRVKATNKKSFFIFCDEKSKNQTYIEKEQKKPEAGRCQTISSFNEFPSIVYSGLMAEIIITYKDYCKGRLVRYDSNRSTPLIDNSPLTISTEDVNVPPIASSSNSSSNNKILAYQNTSSNQKQIVGTTSNVGQFFNIIQVSKNLLKCLPETNNHLHKYVCEFDLRDNFIPSEISDNDRLFYKDFDSVCKNFLDALLNPSKLITFDYNALIGLLGKIHESKECFEIIQLRWNAIKAYFSDDMEKSLALLNQAMEKLEKSHFNNTAWFLNDIYLDLRNINSEKNYRENKWDGQKYQELLNKSDFFVVYPQIDREIKVFYEELVTKNNEQIFDSPNTVRFNGGFGDLTKPLVRFLAIAIIYGSLTPFLCFYDYMKDLFINISKKYSNWSLKVKAMKFTAFNGKRDEFLNLVDSWNDILGKINSRDALSIYSFVSGNPNKSRRFISQLFVFEKLGYYFGDEDYNSISSQICGNIKETFKNPEKCINLTSNISNALRNNALRIDFEVYYGLVKICIDNYAAIPHMWTEICKLMCSVNYGRLPEDAKELFFRTTHEFVKNMETDRPSIPNLEDLIYKIRFVLYKDEDCDKSLNEFDEILKDKFPSLYNNDYRVLLFKENEMVQCEYLQQQLKIINSENGIHEDWYADNLGSPYRRILWLIQQDYFICSDSVTDILKKIIVSLTETLLNKSQMICSKEFAFLLLGILSFKFKGLATFCKTTFKRINEEKEKFDYGLSDLSNVTQNSVYWTYLLFAVSLNENVADNIMIFCSRFSKLHTADKIEILARFSEISNYLKYGSIDKKIYNAFIIFCINACNDTSHDVRFYAVKSLLNLFCDEYADVIVQQFASMMDWDSPFIKSLILKNSDVFEKINSPFVAGILEKGRADTNFLVRNRMNFDFG